MVKRTIRLYLGFTLLTKLGVSFISATYVIFLISRGLNFMEVNLVNLVFHAMIFICEVPTGLVADIFGRKTSFVVSCFLFSGSMFLYSSAHSLPGFMIAEAIAAVGTTFSSGAFQAWVVDKLNYHKYDGSLVKLFSHEQIVSQAAAVIGALAGAFLADYSLIFPWVVAGVILCIAGFLALIFMKEEYFIRQRFSLEIVWQQAKETVTSSMRCVSKSKSIRFIFLLGAVQLFSTQAPNMQWQPLFSPFLSSRFSLGFLYAGIAICIALGSWLSSIVRRLIPNERRAIIGTQFLIGLGVCSTVVFSQFPMMLTAFMIHEVARGIYRPLKDGYLNSHIALKERATLLSFDSMACHIGSMIGLLVSGAIAQNFSVSTAWMISGIAMMIIAPWFFKRNKK